MQIAVAAAQEQAKVNQVLTRAGVETQEGKRRGRLKVITKMQRVQYLIPKVKRVTMDEKKTPLLEI